DLTPSDFRLEQNYPNPFNPTTRIRFEVPKQGLVRLAVYDALGREVKLLIQEIKSAGVYETDFDAENLPSGVYFYRLNSGNFTETRKMMFVK
ncbi:MAG: T9SS type A sorting domain-containing protein, partial [Patescibacteria group bacterium]